MCATTKTERNFYKCPCCLSTVAIDEAPRFGDTFPTCAICDEEMMHMGHVWGGGVYREKYECACDSRCTNAPGPKCECSCGGENHGTGRLVIVYTYEGRATVKPNDTKAAQRRDEFRSALAAARERIEAKYGAERMAAHRSRANWNLGIHWDLVAIGDARRTKVHATRIKSLNSIK